MHQTKWADLAVCCSLRWLLSGTRSLTVRCTVRAGTTKIGRSRTAGKALGKEVRNLWLAGASCCSFTHTLHRHACDMPRSVQMRL